MKLAIVIMVKVRADMIEKMVIRKKNNTTTSKPIIDRGNYSFLIIEDDIDADKLNEREYHYIKNFQCVNMTIPYTDEDSKLIRHRAEEKKRYDENKNFYIIKSRKRYEEKKEEINRKKKEIIVCGCGFDYTLGNKIRHLKTKRHIDNYNEP